MTCRRLTALLAVPAIIALVTPARAGAQQPTPKAAPVEVPASPNPPGNRHEIIRGRVTDDSAHAIAGATVTVTMAPDRSFKQATTDSSGSYRIDFEQGTGDYLLHVAAMGMQTFRKRLTRSGPDTVFTENVTLHSAVQKLAAVKVQAERASKPGRGSDVGDEAGSSEHEFDGVNGQLSPDQEGDLSAIAATTPGVSVTPGGISVLGLGSGQNGTTLNGMAFSGADVPRDARTSTYVATSTYDPSRGWFSGAQTAVELAQGGIFGQRTAHVTLDAPPMQASDPISRQLGARFTNLQASIGGNGAVKDDRYAYNYGLQGGRRFSDYSSIAGANADMLQHAGVSPDSVDRLLQLLGQRGIPVTDARVPSSRATDNVSFIGRLDLAPYDWNTFTPARRTLGVLGYAKYQQSDALGETPIATATHGGQNTQKVAMVQGLFSSFWGKDYLTDVRSGISVADTQTTPYLRTPDGRVLVASDFADGSSGLAGLQFGGNGGLDSRNKGWTWETTTRTQFYAKGKPKHRVVLSADSRLDGVRMTSDGNRYGSFAYNSLADLGSNAPSSYSRTLSAQDRTGGEWNGFVALGDYLRVSQNVQVLYGARLEGNTFTQRPAYNAAVENTFGARTDYAPGSMHVSPRLGFTWVTNGDVGRGFMFNQFGHFSMHPQRYIRGGIGEFRNMLPPSLLADASIATGLPGAAQRVSCVGSAVPTPDWAGYLTDPSSIPTTCANNAPSSFVDAAPGVELFAKDYRPSRSWRANLSYSSSWRRLVYSVEGIYSLNLDQPGTVDLNFANTQQFTLADEANRPVFVPASSIVNATGAVSPVAGRRTSEFGRVVQNVSDLRSVSRQLTFTLSPSLQNIGRWYGSLSYTLADVTQERRGFDGGTFGSPTLVDRTSGDFDIRHQFIAQAAYSWRWGAVSLFGRLQSGTPFTPLVGGDINGDGLANDRAFVFDPAQAADSSVRAGMQSLLATAPGNVRDCLMAQLNHAAGRNSCRTPWTSALNAQLNLYGRRLHMGDRVNLSLNFSNPLGGLDQLLHGDNLRGWGTPAFPDQVLLRPVGFNGTDRFSYQVNPRFGDTRPGSTTLRAPFRVTLDVRLDIGKPIGEQQLDRWINPGRKGHRGTKLTAAELKRRYTRNVPDPYRGILQETDSLLLTRDQVEKLQAAQASYSKQMDTLWTSLADYLANLPDEYDSKTALKRQEDATDAAWELSRHNVQEELPKILSPLQLQLLPWPAQMLYTAKEQLHIRMFMAGGD